MSSSSTMTKAQAKSSHDRSSASSAPGASTVSASRAMIVRAITGRSSKRVCGSAIASYSSNVTPSPKPSPWRIHASQRRNPRSARHSHAGTCSRREPPGSRFLRADRPCGSGGRGGVPLDRRTSRGTGKGARDRAGGRPPPRSRLTRRHTNAAGPHPTPAALDGDRSRSAAGAAACSPWSSE